MRRSNPKDRALRWQAFLIDGFDDWLPAATVAASNMVKATPRGILKGMISDFCFPDGIKQSTDDITAWMEGYAYSINATVRDPKTGEVIGKMRDIKDQQAGRQRKQKPTIARKPTALEQKRAARRAAAEQKKLIAAKREEAINE